MFLTVRDGKVFTDATGRKYGGGHEIDVTERVGESLIRNEVATWSENPKWREANFKLRAIKIKTIKDPAITENVYDSLLDEKKEETPKEITPAPVDADPIEQPKKRMGRPPKHKE